MFWVNLKKLHETVTVTPFGPDHAELFSITNVKLTVSEFAVMDYSYLSTHTVYQYKILKNQYFGGI